MESYRDGVCRGCDGRGLEAVVEKTPGHTYDNLWHFWGCQHVVYLFFVWETGDICNV